MAKTNTSSTKLHIVMYPWFAFGHFIPFLNLSNELAQRGHIVSFVLPKGVISQLKPRNKHPNLIRFFPLILPRVDGLPADANTTSDVRSMELQTHLCTAYDECKDQLEIALTSLIPKPDFIFTDFGYWVPTLARQMSLKTIFFAVVNAALLALSAPGKKVAAEEGGFELPAGYPSSSIRFRPDELATLGGPPNLSGSGVGLAERLETSLSESDAIAIRSCQEMEGKFCDFLAQNLRKPILLTGPIMDDPSATQLEDKWVHWLSKFEPSSAVFCSFGSQVELEKDQYQELLHGFESSGYPFLVALPPPRGCSTVEEAFPRGFEERTRGKGWVYGGWVPQASIVSHPSVGCFVNHGGSGSTWESLLCDSQLVLVPNMGDHVLHTRFMVHELKVAVEVERTGEKRWVSRERLSDAIELVIELEKVLSYVFL